MMETFGFYREHEKLNLFDHATVCLLLKGLHYIQSLTFTFPNDLNQTGILPVRVSQTAVVDPEVGKSDIPNDEGRADLVLLLLGDDLVVLAPSVDRSVFISPAHSVGLGLSSSLADELDGVPQCPVLHPGSSTSTSTTRHHHRNSSLINLARGLDLFVAFHRDHAGVGAHRVGGDEDGEVAGVTNDLQCTAMWDKINFVCLTNTTSDQQGKLTSYRRGVDNKYKYCCCVDN